jgi:hypothetical protein
MASAKELEAVARLRAASLWLRNLITTSSRDWGQDRDLALIYGVIVGWYDPDDPQDVAEGDAALREITSMFPPGTVWAERMQEHRVAFRALEPTSNPAVPLSVSVEATSRAASRADR